MEQPVDPGHQRAKWTKYEELDLLSKYFDARRNPSLATDKGIKAKAWVQLTVEMNAKDKTQKLDKAQYKSKLDRLMRDYDLYKEITSLSGCGICPTTGEPLLDDDVWDKLIEAKPKQKGKIKEFRMHGFEHKTICSMIAGDSRATGANADTVETFLPRLVVAAASATEDDAAAESDGPQVHGETSAESEHDGGTSLPASHQKRVDKVKRIRDGASKSKRGKKKLRGASSSSDYLDKLESLLETAQAYLKVKMQNAKPLSEGLASPPSPQWLAESAREEDQLDYAAYLQQADV